MNFSKITAFLVPKDKKFYPLFEDASDNLLKAAVALNKMMLISDIEQREIVISDIKELERLGDDITHHIFDELNKTFITPFDREDIHQLASSLDDVLDYINSSAQRIRLYKPKGIPAGFVEISELIIQAAREIKTAVYGLRNVKTPAKIKTACIRINEIENLADEVYYVTITNCFREEEDAIELIKNKEIIQTLEKATDMAEDVSDVIKTILVKSA